MSVFSTAPFAEHLPGDIYGTGAADFRPGQPATPVRAVFRASTLPGNLLVQVGAGGAGGLSGLSGGNGGTSTFHTLSSPGGTGGTGGTGASSYSGSDGEQGYVVVWEFD